MNTTGHHRAGGSLAPLLMLAAMGFGGFALARPLLGSALTPAGPASAAASLREAFADAILTAESEAPDGGAFFVEIGFTPEERTVHLGWSYFPDGPDGLDAQLFDDPVEFDFELTAVAPLGTDALFVAGKRNAEPVLALVALQKSVEAGRFSARHDPPQEFGLHGMPTPDVRFAFELSKESAATTLFKGTNLSDEEILALREVLLFDASGRVLRVCVDSGFALRLLDVAAEAALPDVRIPSSLLSQLDAQAQWPDPQGGYVYALLAWGHSLLLYDRNADGRFEESAEDLVRVVTDEDWGRLLEFSHPVSLRDLSSAD